MSDAPSWAAVGASVVALGWAAWVDYRTRREARKAAADKAQGAVDGAISRVVAQWAVTRLRDITWAIDPDLKALKESASRWRQGCAEPLASVSETPRVYELINQTVKAVSEFEGVIDPMREGKVDFDGNVVQNALTRMQSTVWESIHQLIAVKGSTSRGTA